MDYLLARVENFARFEGENLTTDPVMRYGQSGGTPHELYNFFVASDGFIYGSLPKGGGKLERLGGDSGDSKVSGITVIFISSSVLCGYYRNATVFSTPRRHPDFLMAGDSEIHCRVKVAPKNAFLIPANKRNDELQLKATGTWPVLYGDEYPAWRKSFEKLMRTTQGAFGSEAKRIKWTKSAERISNAREMGLSKYGYKCECCKLTHKDKVREAVFEVHHKVPYSEDFKTRELEPSDLAVLCANCHRMIHTMQDLSDIKALRTYLKSRVKHSIPL